MNIINHPMLIFFLFLFCVTSGFISELFMLYPLKKWYTTVRKPKFHPKDRRIGTFWIICYGLMGIAVYFVIKSPKPHAVHMIMFFLQFGLCLAWPVFYFHLKDLKKAYYELIALLVVSIITTILFWTINIAAGVFITPCVPWIIYMTRLNKGVLDINTE